MSEFKYEIGAKAMDKVSGFKGIITAKAKYMNGNIAYEITARCNEGKTPETGWFDEGRIVDRSAGKED